MSRRMLGVSAVVVVVAAALGASAAAAPANGGADRAMTDAIAALGKQRLAELDAQAIAVPAAPADGSAAELIAIGACARPTADERAALTRRVNAWIGKAAPGYRREDDAIGSIAFGCVEAGGTIVDLQADLTRGAGRPSSATRASFTWVLRVRAGAIDVLARAQGCALIDCMEWSSWGSAHVIALVDLDGDGAVEPIVALDDHEVGARPDVRVGVGGGGKEPRVVGHFVGTVAAASLQPPSGDRTFVIALDDGGGVDGRPRFRCIGATGAWSTCPAAARAERFERARTAARALIGQPAVALADRDALAASLDLLGVPAAQRGALLSAARPGPAPTVGAIVARFLADRDAVIAARTPDEQAEARAAAERRRADAVRAITGEAACAPARGTSDATYARVRAWIRAHDRARLVFGDAEGCVDGARGYWFATWDEVSAGATARHRALFWVAGGKVRLVLGGVTAVLDEDPQVGPMERDGAAMFRVKLAKVGGALTALVEGPDTAPALTAVVDGAITGIRTDPGLPQLVWQAWDADADGDTIDVRGDSLAYGQPLDVVTFWHATPGGVAALATFPLPEVGQPLPTGDAATVALAAIVRDREAAAFLRGYATLSTRTAPTRARAVAALTALGAPQAVVDAAANATP